MRVLFESSAAIILLLAGCQAQPLAEPSLSESLEVLSWTAPDERSAFDCRRAAWVSAEPRGLSAGPFSIEATLRFDRSRSGSLAKPVALLRFAGAEVSLLPGGILSASRVSELRMDGTFTPNAKAAETLGPEIMRSPLKLRVEWTGRRLEAYANGKLALSLDSEGTRRWTELEIGPFPGELRALSLRAR